LCSNRKKQKCGPGQPPGPHGTWIFCSRLDRHSRDGMTLLARQRSRGSATFARAGCTPRSCDHELQPLRRPAAQSHSQVGSERRPQRPGQPGTRSHAFSGLSSGDSPSRITGCCRPCRNHPASSENSHVFAAATLHHRPVPRNRKQAPPCAETVDDNSSLWKPEENREGCGITPTKAIKMKSGAPRLAPFARRPALSGAEGWGFSSYRHDRGCPTLRDFRRVGVANFEAVALTFTASADRPRAPASA
jgi:hypothetical protein